MSDLVKNTCERVMNTQLNADERALALQNASASALSDPMASAFFRQFIDSMDIRLASSDSNEQLETRIEEYQQLLADMINGPMYLGWIIEAAVPGFEGANPRALLLTQKGEHSVATYPRSMWENLPQNGDMVLCAGPLVVGSVPTELNAMPSVAMEFVRRLENNLVECKSPEGRVSTHHCVGQMRQIVEAQADIETTDEGQEPAVD